MSRMKVALVLGVVWLSLGQLLCGQSIVKLESQSSSSHCRADVSAVSQSMFHYLFDTDSDQGVHSASAFAEAGNAFAVSESEASGSAFQGGIKSITVRAQGGFDCAGLGETRRFERNDGVVHVSQGTSIKTANVLVLGNGGFTSPSGLFCAPDGMAK